MQFSMKRMLTVAGICVAMVLGTMVNAGHAAGQGGDSGGGNGIVGTWTSAIPDGQGGTNYSWYTFGQDGSYRMVSAIQGGRNAGNVIQRWGQYQARPLGQGQYQATVRVTGGAPAQVCSQGQGCTPVQGIQRTMQWQLQVRNGQLVQGSSVFQRGQVPAQLQAQMGDRTIQGPTMPTLHPYQPISPSHGGGGSTTKCDDLQQSRICTYGNGGYYHKDNATGCMVCDTY